MYNAILDQTAQKSRRENAKIISDKFTNCKCKLKNKQENTQETERVFEIWLLLLRKTSVLRNVKTEHLHFWKKQI